MRWYPFPFPTLIVVLALGLHARALFPWAPPAVPGNTGPLSLPRNGASITPRPTHLRATGAEEPPDRPPATPQEWHNAHASGQHWLTDLATCRRTPSRLQRQNRAAHMGGLYCDPPQEIVRWTPFPTVTLMWNTPLRPTQNTYTVANVRSVHGPTRGQILYRNAFDARRGVLILESNWRSLDYGPEPRPYLSDILRHCYGAAEDRVGGRRGRRDWARAVPPGLIVLRQVKTGATMKVLVAAQVRRGASPHVRQRWEAEGHDEEAFTALMGTPHGKTVIHMLRDFCEWAGRRTVRAVETVWAREPGTERAGWYMLIELSEGPFVPPV